MLGQAHTKKVVRFLAPGIEVLCADAANFRSNNTSTHDRNQLLLRSAGADGPRQAAGAWQVVRGADGSGWVKCWHNTCCLLLHQCVLSQSAVPRAAQAAVAKSLNTAAARACHSA